MRGSEALLDTTVFLGGRDDGGSLHYRATAFLVGMPSKRLEIYWSCLVTARHNIRKAMQIYGNVYVRVNTIGGSAIDIEVREPWAYPQAGSSDVAVVPFDSIYYIDGETLSIPPGWFVTDELVQARSIGLSDKLIVIGLFSKHVGKSRNLPIARRGNIASMPREPHIDPNTGEPYEAYLAEVRSMGGLSGSPVFVQTDPNVRPVPGDREARRQPFYLLGLIRGHWRAGAEADFSDDDFTDGELGQLNTGVAIVTPIAEILPIFETERFLTYGQRMDKLYDAWMAADHERDSAIEDWGEDNGDLDRIYAVARTRGCTQEHGMEWQGKSTMIATGGMGQ